MRFAMLFPGQGSQHVGMLSELATEHDIIEQTFKEASQVLNLDLWTMSQTANDSLNLTMNTQPLLLTASIALHRLFSSQCDKKPAMVAGHSLGEYSALVVTGAIDFHDALKLVRLRGELMQAAVPAGRAGMSAVIGLDDATVTLLCEQVANSEVLEPANFNAPGQVVVAGHDSALNRLESAAKEAGAKLVKRLPMSVPSHCALLKTTADELATTLANTPINEPSIDYVNNVDVSVLRHPDDIRDALRRQLYSPVQWASVMSALVESDIDRFIEVGPGKVLTGLAKRICKDKPCVPFNTPNDLANIVREDF